MRHADPQASSSTLAGAPCLGFLRIDEPFVGRTHDARARARVRLHLADGAVCTVWDATFANFRHHRTRHRSPRATHGGFVAPDGTKRLFRLKSDSDRVLEAAVLAEQLCAAEYVARDRFRPDDVQPGRSSDR